MGRHDTSTSFEDTLVSNGASIANLDRKTALSGHDSRIASAIRLTNVANNVFSDVAVQQERNKLENSLNVKEGQFGRGEQFERPWYSKERKFRKTKLGSLHHCTFKDIESGVLCRVMNYDRISSYQIEAFFTELAKI